MKHYLFRILFATIFLLSRQASARLGVSWLEDHQPSKFLSDNDLSQAVLKELRVLHDQGVMASLKVPQITKRVHRIIVEGSANASEPFDHEARGRALKALHSAADCLLTSDESDSFELTQQQENSLRHFAEYDDRRSLATGDVKGRVALGAMIVFFVIAAVSNLVNAATGGTEWPYIGAKNDFITGTLGENFKSINPCSRLPLQGDLMYSYLPITNGFATATQDLVGNGNVVEWFKAVFDPKDLNTEENRPPDDATCTSAGRDCQFTAECCKEDNFLVNCNEQSQCEMTGITSVPDNFVVEAFCLLWSDTSDGNFIDTLAFSPLNLWPPIDPIRGAPTILPKCPPEGGSGPPRGCQHCEFVMGFPIKDFAIFPMVYKLLFQFSGVAFSWADTGKLTFGNNKATKQIKIWDGFRDIDLPPIPDMNFWLAFRLEIVPLPTWTLRKQACERGVSEEDVEALKNSAFSLSLIMDFEIYVAFDKQTDKDAAGEKLSTDLLGPQETESFNEDKSEQHRRRRRKRDFYEEKERKRDVYEENDMWRSLQSSSEDPCAIITMTEMRLTMPSVGRLIFGSSVGGFCNFSPEETGIQCTPNGFFLNIDQSFRIELGPAGVLGSIFDSSESETVPVQTGNSLGIFQNADGENEAVLFRLEYPVTSLFGVSVTRARPEVHFQIVKGSEVQRRRATLLRKRKRTSNGLGPWVANCKNVEEKCSPNGWVRFENEETQICSDILLNDNKLQYYNRVITAETVDKSLKYVISPPSGSAFKTPAKYNFESNPDSNIIILYLALKDIGNIVISIKEISVSLVVSEGTPAGSIPEDVLVMATQLYNKIADEFKEENGGIWRPPNAYNFPSLAKYEEYLPAPGKELKELIESGAIERAEDFNETTNENEADRTGVFVSLFCKIAVLFFIQISIGLIVENFGDGTSPDSWTVAGQFQVDLLDLRYSVAVFTTFNFDSRRYRHLEEEEYNRALASKGLENADYDVDMSIECVPDSVCAAIVEFFEDVGEAIWEGMQAIGAFFAEDVAGFVDDALGAIGEWGKNFVGELANFAKNVAEDIADVFENGEVKQLLDSGVEAFNEDTKKAVSTLSDGKVDFNDVLAAGEFILRGVELGIKFIVAGIKDLVAAIGSFFNNVAQGIADWLGLGKPWDELRHKKGYENFSCKEKCDEIMTNDPDNKDQIKTNCWCTDEFECHVKIPQMRTCRKKSYFFYVETKCDKWRDVAIRKGNTYPRFDGRQFDAACRQERMADLARAKGKFDDAVQTSSLIDKNFGSNFKGLRNFSPNSRRRRFLQGGVDGVTAVRELRIENFRATFGGAPGKVSPGGFYDGARLQPNSTNVNNVASDITADFDFSEYNYPGLERDDSAEHQNGTRIKLALQRAAAVPYLGDLNTNDEVFLSRQPIIEPPKLSIVGVNGTSQYPLVLQCSDGNIASAWLDKLESFEPETMRRRRTRRLSSEPIKETLVEFIVEAILKERIMNEDGIHLLAELGNIDGAENDIFLKGKNLLGTDGAGSFMNPNNFDSRRRLEERSISQYNLELSVMNVNPLCDRFEWTFEATISDATGKSNPVLIEALLFYGPSVIEAEPPSSVQTRCDSDPYEIEDLEDNKALLYFTGYDSFKPALKVDNCPSPFLYLSAENKDTIINEGEPCTTNYKVVERGWSLFTHEDDCPPPTAQNPFFIQTITLGGYADLEQGIEPDTPIFELQPMNYYLPNEPRAEISSNVTDFFRDGVAPTSECGLCSDPTKASIVYSHPENFVCSEEGENIVSIEVLNQIGVKVEKQTIARVFDDFPPNMATKTHTVYLNQFGWLDEANKIKAEDIDAFTWDNCGIKEMFVDPSPFYQCGDEGPQTVNLTAVDTSIENGGNTNSQAQIITVDDTRRLGIGDDEYLSLRKSTKNFVKEYLEGKFDYHDCKEVGVYIRPKGESNFSPLNYSAIEDFEGFFGEDDWDIPKLDICDEESVFFHSAICQTDDKLQFVGCEGEVKAEVLCREGRRGKKDNRERKQTCYRAKVITYGKKSAKDKICKGVKSSKSRKETKEKGNSRHRRRRGPNSKPVTE